MSKLTRRKLLMFFGSSAAATVLAPHLSQTRWSNNSSVVQAQEVPLSFTPVRLPHPLPIYQTQNNFMPTGIGQGTIMDASPNPSLGSYNAIDDVVVPPEYERYVIVRWGDRVFPDKQDYFGYNSDYTSFVPLNGSFNDGLLWVNHEYVSFPISALAPETPDDLIGLPTSDRPVLGFNLPTVKNRDLMGEFLYNLGGSVVRIARPQRGDRFAVVPNDPINRRIHGLSGLAINSQRPAPYNTVTAWGFRQGDNNYLLGTGPTATQVFEQVNADGLGNRIIGTAYNCSGGTTPWGTILSAEENFQGSEVFFVGVQEEVLPNGTQTSYIPGTTGAEFGQVGEKYGWMVEVDPANLNFHPRKHTALGRFRHENIALRIQPGQKLIGYMGDDRRGGHTWKYVSAGAVGSPTNKGNSSLFENGTLYVARYNPDGTGQWIPLDLNTSTNPIPPSVLASIELAALGEAQRDGRIRLPKRAGIAGQTADGGSFIVDLTNEATALPDYVGKRLSNFYTSQGAVLVDAFLAANLIGGTPTARPEDIEVHPRTQEVYIAYTDGAAGSDGYPDSRIFVVGKYSSAIADTPPNGALYKIIEDSPDGTGTTFRWQRFAHSGEAAAEQGEGFGNVDNLAFDSRGNIWGVTDMSTSRHNGFGVGANPEPRKIDHTETGDPNALVGVYGNNWMFFIPTLGTNAGQLLPFAYGPVRCEMTGPTFADDTLLLAVQHPGEDVPINDGTTLSRGIEMLNLNGGLFNQNRTVPRGSSWPSNIEGNPVGPPRPSVIGIRRLESPGRFI